MGHFQHSWYIYIYMCVCVCVCVCVCNLQAYQILLITLTLKQRKICCNIRNCRLLKLVPSTYTQGCELPKHFTMFSQTQFCKIYHSANMSNSGLIPPMKVTLLATVPWHGAAVCIQNLQPTEMRPDGSSWPMFTDSSLTQEVNYP